MTHIRVGRFVPSIDLLLFGNLLAIGLPWPLISIALVVQFVSSLFAARRKPEPEVIYLPRLPFEVHVQIASWLSTPDLVRLAQAGFSTNGAANTFLYRTIVLEELPSANIPWFRRRLYRLTNSLTPENASLIRHLDVSWYQDIDDEYLSSIIRKCTNLVSLSYPAIQEPLQSLFGKGGYLIKQPVFLTPNLSVPAVYANLTSLTWTGPFIPFRGGARYSGRAALPLFSNLRILKMIYRPDSFDVDGIVKCTNVYTSSIQDGECLEKDLGYIAASCPLLEELVFPFWEVVYSLAGKDAFKLFTALRLIKFLAIDGPMKDLDYGRGLLKFIVEMRTVDVQVTFLNPWQKQVDIIALIDEVQSTTNVAEALSQLHPDQEIKFGPVGPIENVWLGRQDVIANLEWTSLSVQTVADRPITLVWPITLSEQPSFTIPSIFTRVEFRFNTPARRDDARQFLKFRHLLMQTVDIPHIRRVHVEMEYVDAFYLAFPLFMQFSGDRILSLRVEKLLLSQRKGWETWWIRRNWKIKRRKDFDFEEVGLEGLREDAIHVHPARLFERNMTGLFFCGERNIQEIVCVFHDRYSRS